MSKEYSLKEVAEITGAEIEGNPEHRVSSFAALDQANESQVSFLGNRSYNKMMASSQAGAILIQGNVPREEGKNYLVVEDPTFAFQQVVELFVDQEKTKSGFEDIHPCAVIHASAKIGNNVKIGPNAVIDREAVVGDNSVIRAGCFIGASCTIGDHCYFHPNVTIREGCVIGDRVHIQPGAVIGSCGYGYVTNKQGEHIKLKQLGNVVIEDDVEIGANSTIDRGRFDSTIIGKGTKIDNLVQIAHNVVIGQHNLIVAQVGIAGSAKTGRHVVLAGQTGVVGHVELADGVIVGAQSGVPFSIPKAGAYGGAPAIPVKQRNKLMIHLLRLPEYAQQIKALSEKLEVFQKSACASNPS